MLTISGVGRLGSDPKLQYTPAGTAQVSLSVASDCGFGEGKSTVWLSAVAFGAQAETYNKFLSKGSRIGFTAELSSIKPFVKNDDTPGVYTNVKILTLEFLSPTKNQETSGEVEEF